MSTCMYIQKLQQQISKKDSHFFLAIADAVQAPTQPDAVTLLHVFPLLSPFGSGFQLPLQHEYTEIIRGEAISVLKTLIRILLFSFCTDMDLIHNLFWIS